MTSSKKIKLIGRTKLQVFDKEGNLLDDTGWLYNTITNTGLAGVAGLIGNTGSISAFTYLAVGTDSTAESAGHSALQAEITDSGLERVAATVSRVTTTQTNDTLNLTYTWTATGSKTVEEIGIFNAASSGIMLGRKLTGSISIVSTNNLIGTYQVIIS